MPRPRDEIMRDLKAILAELDYAMGFGPNTDPGAAKVPEGALKGDLSPKLEQALEATQPKTHDEIRAQARAYKPSDYKPSDYKPAKDNVRDLLVDDPDWPPDSIWMGTGDHKLIE
jgi:hypothetical protein